MNEKNSFYILDVFAEKKYAGNQLAVFRNGERYQDAKMQAIAKEMNFSETTFILSDLERKGGYDVRIFTPNEEVPFAGHPTLGTSYVIQREIIDKPITSLSLNLKIGQITVEFSYREGAVDTLFMKQNPPVFGKEFNASELLAVLNLKKGDIDERFPVQEVSTGLPFILVPIRDLETLKRIKVDREKYFDLIKDIPSKAIMVFSPGTTNPENQLSVRVFADYFGVAEDPATGSANGCLAGYLVNYRYFGENKIDIKVEQGCEIGRPSLLYLRAEEVDKVIDVHVGGKVVMVARGELL